MNKLATVVLVGVFIASGASLADQPGADWLTRQAVTEKLQAQGYTKISMLEADDGHWEGRGLKGGQWMEFHVDPHTGSLIKEERDH